jgi:hypothetical protein
MPGALLETFSHDDHIGSMPSFDGGGDAPTLPEGKTTSHPEYNPMGQIMGADGYTRQGPSLPVTQTPGDVDAKGNPIKHWKEGDNTTGGEGSVLFPLPGHTNFQPTKLVQPSEAKYSGPTAGRSHQGVYDGYFQNNYHSSNPITQADLEYEDKDDGAPTATPITDEGRSMLKQQYDEERTARNTAHNLNMLPEGDWETYGPKSDYDNTMQKVLTPPPAEKAKPATKFKGGIH